MQIPRRKPLTANVAVLSVGLDTYWAQFPGLLEELRKKTDRFLEKLQKHSVNVTDFGMIDNSRKAYDTLPQILASDPDVLFVDMVTYATSATFAAIVRSVSCPVVLVALQPLEAMLRQGCLGQLPEIYDGDFPTEGKGCFGQAWSVGEMLRVFEAIEK